MSDQRGTPVTLEEMTRRRDGWRVKWDQSDRESHAAQARERAAVRRAQDAESAADRREAEIRHMENRLTGAQAEARRYAVECGRLRDELALQRETMTVVCDDCCARIAERLRGGNHA